MRSKINNANRDSKSNLLNLSGSISMQSIEAKAVRAALIARTEQDLRKADKAPAQRSKRYRRTLTQLERELKMIKSAFERTQSDKVKVVISRPESGSSAICVITKSSLRKEGEVKRTYVFYPSVTEPDRLGSVAIYGSNVVSDMDFIRRKGNLFGKEVSSVSIEMGRRAYLDVTFRA